MVLDNGVYEVKFLLAVEEKMLTTETYGQTSFNNLAKMYSISRSRLFQIIMAGDDMPMKKRR